MKNRVHTLPLFGIVLSLLILQLVLAALVGQRSVHAVGLYDSGWQYRVKISVNFMNVGATHSNFPVYINLGHMPAVFFDHVKSDGADIRVTAADEITEVPYELVSINTTAHTGELYLKAPVLSNVSNTDFYIYYGNAAATAHAPTATYGSENVWNDYLLAYHMAENPGGTAPQVKDSTSFSADGSTYGSMTLTDLVAGKLGTGYDLDGTGDGIGAGDYADMGTSDMTVSMWFKTLYNKGGVISKSYYGGLSSRWYTTINDQGIGAGLHGTSSTIVTPPRYLGTNNNAWHLMHAQFDRDGLLTLSIDGVVRTTGSIAVLNGQNIQSNFYLFFGLYNDELTGTAPHATVQRFEGQIDEARVQARAVGDSWVSTEYANQNDPATFYSVGAEESAPPSGVLAADIINTSDESVVSPAITMSPVYTAFDCTSSTGTIGTSAERIRVSNGSGTASWSLSLAATAGSNALWSDGTSLYDYNDPSGSPAGCNPGIDSDTYAGQLGVDFQNTIITPATGCTSTGVSVGTAAAFSEGITDVLTLMSANNTASVDCHWDLTGVDLEQRIPAMQSPGNYTMSLTLTVVAN